MHKGQNGNSSSVCFSYHIPSRSQPFQSVKPEDQISHVFLIHSVTFIIMDQAKPATKSFVRNHVGSIPASAGIKKDIPGSSR